MKKISITIGESIRVQPYETVKRIVTMDYEVPDSVDLDDFYQEKYKEVKRIWNMHLYNMLYNVDLRKIAKVYLTLLKIWYLGKRNFLNSF